MAITVNIISKNRGKIKAFFNEHYKDEACIENEVVEWTYTYRDERKALNIIKLLESNAHTYGLSVWVRKNCNDLKQLV